MKRIPSIKSVMTAFPYWVDIEERVDVARQFMQENKINHLPVKQSGKLVSVVTDRDIDRRLFADDTREAALAVRDVCVLQAYIVDINEPLDNVLITMAMEHIGSAIVVKGDRLAGLFTLNDACRVFATDLRERFRPANGNDAA